MKGINWKIAAATGIATAAILSSFALASVFAAGALTASCSGTVSGATVTWAATSTGGNAPYSFLWSGDPSVAGSTSTSVAYTYGANGTYYATTTVTDASSTTASANCSATVDSIPAPTSTLNVVVAVSNTAGGTATPSDFTVSVSGANADPSSFAGSTGGTAVIVDADTAYAVGASSVANYSASESGNCAGPIAAGATGSCTITETYVGTFTPPHTIMPAMLSINPEGHFLAHGMIVTSIASGSFQATVWGITYTVNWSGNLSGDHFELWFRGGPANGTSTVTNQLQVGDEVGVSGIISPSSPLVVNSDVVRDYSVTAPRQPSEFQGESLGQGNGSGNGGNGNLNGNEGENGNVSASTSNSSSVSQFQSRIDDLMNRLKGLENTLHGHSDH